MEFNLQRLIFGENILKTILIVLLDELMKEF